MRQRRTGGGRLCGTVVQPVHNASWGRLSVPVRVYDFSRVPAGRTRNGQGGNNIGQSCSANENQAGARFILARSELTPSPPNSLPRGCCFITTCRRPWRSKSQPNRDGTNRMKTEETPRLGRQADGVHGLLTRRQQSWLADRQKKDRFG